jgi:LPS-assembly protein
MQAYAQSAETTASSSASVAGELPALQLKSSSLLQESYPQEVRDQQPTYIKGDSPPASPISRPRSMARPSCAAATP